MAEYTTFGVTPPGNKANYSDGNTITLGNVFFLTGISPIANPKVVGGRVWTGLGGVPANSNIKIRLYEIPAGNFVNPLATAAVKEVVAPINPSGWTTGYFSTPWVLPRRTSAWMIGYTMNEDARQYLAASVFRPTNNPYTDYPDNGLVISQASGTETGVSSWYHGYYRYGNGSQGNSNLHDTNYLVDSIVSDTPTGPSISLWNGASEVPVTCSVWNGTIEVPAVFDSVV